MILISFPFHFNMKWRRNHESIHEIEKIKTKKEKHFILRMGNQETMMI